MSQISEIIGGGGRIATRLEGYEQRSEQMAMAEAVSQAITEQQHLIVEAGTGVGKSFAYLVPAILEATRPLQESASSAVETAPPKDNRARRRVIISTHTINLQEQLLGKDIPLLRSVIPQEFTAVLAKGRRNYVSKRRLETATTGQ